jgi:dCMP deaminase
MPDQNKLDKKYLKMAKVWAEMSYAVRKKVGCLIVKGTQIISDGYNGTPSGFDNNCEDQLLTYDKRDTYYEKDEWVYNHLDQKYTRLKTKLEVLHAESNALMKLARSHNSSEGATMYSTCSPCFDCAKLIIQSGISRVVYSSNYRDSKGLELLQKANIQVDCIYE